MFHLLRRTAHHTLCVNLNDEVMRIFHDRLQGMSTEMNDDEPTKKITLAIVYCTSIEIQLADSVAQNMANNQARANEKKQKAKINSIKILRLVQLTMHVAVYKSKATPHTKLPSNDKW